MLEGNLNVILLPVIIAIALVNIVAHWRISKEASPVTKAINRVKLMTISIGAFWLVLWFALPSTSVLSSFGYPEEVRSLTEATSYLQQYNRALVRTIQIVYWFLFVFVWWFLAVLYEFSKAIMAINAKAAS